MLSQVADYDTQLALDWLPTDTGKRIRKTSIRVTLALLAVAIADTARAIVMRQPRPEPVVATSMYEGTSHRPEPQPDMPSAELYELLRDHKIADKFLHKHVTGYAPKDPSDFCSRFRNESEAMLDQKKAECNNLAEFWCRLWQANGRTPYMVSMWPTRQREWSRRNEDIKDKKGWHMIAAYKRNDPTTGEEQYVIGNNQSAVEWCGTLEEYATSLGMEILPVGGVRKYRPLPQGEDFRVRIWDMAGLNETPELSPKEERLPLEGLSVAAAK